MGDEVSWRWRWGHVHGSSTGYLTLKTAIYGRMNQLVLLYEKCNSIRIMSINTYNRNVDIIWHYCIISQITLHGFWKRSALTNMKKDALKYMINRLWYGIFHITCHINPRPILALGLSAVGLIWASRVDVTCDMKIAT
jgi:hypothetical protein